MTPKPDSWRSRANCIDRTELFFPEHGEHTGPARAVCDDCEVRTQCLEYALESYPEFGIWGGMSTTQLTRERRRRRKAS